MTFIYNGLAEDVSKKNSTDLARHMGVVPKEAILFIDNSMISSFVMKRMIPEKDARDGLTLAELWDVEHNHVRDLFVETYEKAEYPAFASPTRIEFNRGLKEIVKRIGDPYEALCYRWGQKSISCVRNFEENNEEEIEHNSASLRRFIESMISYKELFAINASRAYLLPKGDRAEKPAIQRAIGSLVIEKGRGRPEHKMHDAVILAEAYPLSTWRPVYISTGDRDFLGLHAGLMLQEDKLANRYGYRPRRGDITIVLDEGNKEPYLQKSSDFRKN